MTKARSPRQSSLPGMGEVDGPPLAPAPAGEEQPPQSAATSDLPALDPPSVSEQPCKTGGHDAAGASEAPSETKARANAAPARPFAASDLKGKRVWAIDANSLIFQVFHAIPQMTSPKGQPVNAVFGFTRDLLFLLEKKKPDYLFCSFDTRAATFRQELYAEYKGQRAEMPAELSPQFPLIRRMIEALGIPILELDGYEADDVLATIAHQVDAAGGECVVVTGDKDCRQLITDRVSIYNVRKDQIYDAAALLADWGIRPDQVVDFQTMVGDSVDNIPGIPLIGPKIARELLNQFDTLEGIFANADKIAGAKRKQNIIEGQARAPLTRQLVRLDTAVPIAIDWRAAETGPIDPQGVIALCGEFGFHRFAEQARQWQGGTEKVDWQANSRLVDSLEKLQELLPTLLAQSRVAIELQPAGRAAVTAAIRGIALCWRPGEAWYLPLAVARADELPLSETSSIDPKAALAALRPIFENAQIQKVSRDLKQDTLLLASGGVTPAGMTFDTTLASYLLDAGERNHTLAELSERFLNHAIAPPSEEKDSASSTPAWRGAAELADVAFRLTPMLEQKLRDEQLDELFFQTEVPLIRVLARLERTGVRVDPARLAELSQEYGARARAIESEIYALAGHEFNIASPKQLQAILFTEQKLPALRRTKSGPSTDASVLEELAALHPLPKKIIEFRQYTKLKNTYVDALPSMVNPKTGRVHATFQQAVAATGRLSSTDPNLQNIPIRTREGREIRSAFLPGEPNWLLLAADYSQIELRVLAHFSGDATLCEAFAQNEDIHSLVAAQVFGVPQKEVTSEMRRRAKAVNFGVLYGQSPFGLAKSLNIEQSEAAEFIDAYYDRYPGVEKLLAGILADCRANGYVKTILGRKRGISGVRPDAGRLRNLPERTAINTVIQGSAADLIKLAMLSVQRALEEQRLASRMLLQIHDELLFESPPAELETLAQLVRREMSSVAPLDVPLVVDIKTGHNWAETQPWTEASGDTAADFSPGVWEEPLSEGA
ncbi:MAG TPA: DNA polymerase I [Pirellulales bacterium]